MRNLTNLESIAVAGGEYYPIWSVEETENTWSSFDFDDFGFGNGDGWGTKSKGSQKPSDREIADVIEELRKALPNATVSCTAKANNKGPNGTVQWELECSFTIKTKG